MVQLKVTNETPFAALRHFPQRGQQGGRTNSPWYFQNGILRTAPDPSGAMRRLPFQGRLVRTLGAASSYGISGSRWVRLLFYMLSQRTL